MTEYRFGNKWLHTIRMYCAMIYGAGMRGNTLFHILQDNGYEVKAVIDRELGKKCGSMTSVRLEDIEKGNRCVCIISPLLPPNEMEKIKRDIAEYFPVYFHMSDFERMLYFEPPFDECMNYKAAKPFNHYESPYTNRIEYEFLQENEEVPPNNVDLNLDMQLGFMKSIGKYANDFHSRYNDRKFRYRHNDMFEDGDAMVYHSMIRHYNPKCIIEIGSGFSTAVALDTFDFWDCVVDMTCIEPNPNRLYSIMKKADRPKVKIIEDILQNVNLNEFDRLDENDILFIDSSHVLKSGGDVALEFLRIIPRLQSGVIIHVHDIFYPFKYPSNWVAAGCPYTEAFLLHAFLMDNQNYELLFWEDFIGRYYKQAYEKHRGPVPDVGSSFWMRKR